MMKQSLLIFLSMQGLILEAVTTNLLMTYASIFSLHILLMSWTVCLIQSLMLALLMHLQHG